MVLVNSKSSASNNPFRDGVAAEANLGSEHQFTMRTSESAQSPSSQPTGDRNTSAHILPMSAPPAYTDGNLLSIRRSGREGVPAASNSENLVTSIGSDTPHLYAVLPSVQQDIPPFSRQAPRHSYPNFEPTFLRSTGQYLTRGFPAAPPPSSTTPHPFASHDVTESDWLK